VKRLGFTVLEAKDGFEAVGKRLINRIFTASQNYVKDFSKRFEEEFDDTMAVEQS
jgi:hypothetical protein